MVEDLNAEEFLDGGLDLLDTRIAELDDLARVGEYDVVVLLDLVRTLVLGDLVTKLVLPDQAAIHQQFNGVVERRSRNPVIALLHMSV